MSNDKLYYLNEVDETKDFWNCKVRIIKKWDLKWRLDVIMIDENGNKMQGYVREKPMEDFNPLLQEDAVLLIKGCGVGVQNDKFPVLNCPKKIIFYKSHPYGFHFKKLEVVSDKMMGKGVTVDIIGNISWCGNMDCFKNTLGKDTKRLHLDLQNLESKMIRIS